MDEQNFEELKEPLIQRRHSKIDKPAPFFYPEENEEQPIHKLDTVKKVEIENILNQDRLWDYQPSYMQTKKHIKEHFGEHIKPSKYTSIGAEIYMLCILGCVIIPVEIFLKETISGLENTMIKSIQSQLEQPGGSYSQYGQYIIQLAKVIQKFSEVDAIRYTVYFLYLFGDAILATKTALVAFFGEFCVVIIKILYKEPRPYWVDSGVKGYLCQNDFEGPSDHLFIIFFLYTYINLIFFRKYAKKSHRCISITFFLLEGILIVLTMISGVILGHTYLYQNIIGIVYGLFYLILCLQLDNEIHMIVEKCAFIQKKARKYKFYILFLTIGIFVVSLIYFNLDLDQWNTPPIQWYLNSRDKCFSQIENFQASFIGYKETFLDTSIILCIPIMFFGVSLSITLDEDNIKWTKTSWNQTFPRVVIGMGCAAGIELFFIYLNHDMINHTSIFVWQYVFPYVITTFFIYGIMPSISEAINLSRITEVKESTESSRVGSNQSYDDRKILNLKDIKVGDLEQMKPRAEKEWSISRIHKKDIK